MPTAAELFALAAHHRQGGNLGTVCERLVMVDEAVHCFSRAVQINPNVAYAHHHLGCALLKRGQLELASIRQALRLQPDLAEAQRALLCTLNYDPQADPDAVFEEHCRWGRLHQLPAPPLPHANDHTALRRLRIGYASGDFCFHALAHYLESVLAHHNLEQVEVFCYAEVAKPDHVTRRLQTLPLQWYWTCRQSDAEVAERIRIDRIDILVDLAGHTAYSRSGVVALKPAPIQATWLGYMNTTGLPVIDYRLTDEILDPPGQPVRDTEELFRLPAGFCCFLPPSDAPPVSPLPALAKGCVTFGSLHAMWKVNMPVLDLWCRVLKAVPGSRLLMFHHTLMPAAQAMIQNRFVENAVDPQRLELRPGHRDPGYLGVYHEIDLGLDAFPCTGGVTTCESLWMGVPVLTLAGARPAGRNSAAILNRVGLSDWVVDSPEQYVDLAARWSSALPRLALLRGGPSRARGGDPLERSRHYQVARRCLPRHVAALVQSAW